MDKTEVRPSDAVQLHFKILSKAGFCKPLKKSNSNFSNNFQSFYIFIGYVINITYNLQHVVFIFQVCQCCTRFLGRFVSLRDLIS